MIEFAFAVALIPWRIAAIERPRAVSSKTPELQAYINRAAAKKTIGSWMIWLFAVAMLVHRTPDRDEVGVLMQALVFVVVAIVVAAYYWAVVHQENAEPGRRLAADRRRAKSLPAGSPSPFTAAPMFIRWRWLSTAFALAVWGIVADLWLVVCMTMAQR